jgi:hypothetical protein
MMRLRVGYRRIDQRRAEAEERQEARDARGDAGQIARLEASGHGHCKEAKRLRRKVKQ